MSTDPISCPCAVMLTVLLPANGPVADGPVTVAVTVCDPKLSALVDIWKLHPLLV
jgi:hypothetical protein